MQSWLSHLPGGPETLSLDDVEWPEPRENQVRVRVAAVGINFPDALLIRDLYQVKPDRPFSPGGEFSGVVDAVGAGVTGLNPGDAVVGISGWGALAEYFCVEAGRLTLVPREIPMVEAAAFLFTYATAYHALFDVGRVKPGETVLVLGAAGGVGSAAIDLARATGARVIAGASSREKLEFALAAGAESGFVYARDMASTPAQKALSAEIKKLAPGGVDIVVDPVGGGYSEPALRTLAHCGRHLVVGFTAGIPAIPLNAVLLRSSKILGVDWRTFTKRHPKENRANVQELFRLWKAGEISPRITKTLPFGRVPEAIADIESRSVLGKIAVDLDINTARLSIEEEG
ncbi:NADPH:quinone oxidoreductase family protein [Nocardioides insulae]|uniref:NADPH:quinone oxidoreductase family protein n=1 Tax=Nocardioides insulae TaxID=394734 RepID=UPI0006862036|nr:NADPH:quinone oxidoreductase family protein [Nocardioides insulae]